MVTNVWLQVEKLEPNKTLSDAVNGNGRIWFGVSIALYGDMAVVGARISNAYTGDVYMYTRNDNGIWEFLYYLTAFDGVQGDDFGGNVELTDTYLVVSARGKTINGTNDAGSVYIYQYGEAQTQIPSQSPTNTVTSNPTSL